MIYIETQIEFNNLCAKLEQEKAFALDCEFMRETRFVPKLCLIQIATSKHIYIIDPIKLNLKFFLELLLNENIMKIMHSSMQDIDVFYKNFEVIPNNIFDTQIAASFLGYGDSVSYAKLVKKIAKISLCKQDKLTNWQNRPISNSALNYAANDVKHLFPIQDKLVTKLIKLKRLSWYSEEIEKLYILENYYLDPDLAWQKITQNSEVEFSLNYLRAFAKYREHLAVKLNKPRRFIIRDEFLVRLAKLQPHKMEDFVKDRILSKMISKNLLADLIEISNKTKLEKTELVAETKYKLSDSQILIADYLKIYLKYIAKENKLSVKNIATTRDIERFIKGFKVIFSSGWRYDLFGKMASEILAGNIALLIKDQKLTLTKLRD